MANYTNTNNVSVAVAAWLAYDSYKKGDSPKTISVTELAKPIKELALARSPAFTALPQDVSNLRASRLGTAVHDSIRDVWEDPAKRKQALKALGIKDSVIDRVRVNPKDIDESYLNVFTEQRNTRHVAGWAVTGEFDFFAEESFQDFKNTGTYTYEHNTKVDDYIQQLSCYQWLFPDLPSNGVGKIHYLFTNWSAGKLYMDNYPKSDMVTIDLNLWSLTKTEQWIKKRLSALDVALTNLSDQNLMPPCTDKEKWQKASTFKYYSKVGAKRASRNFGEDSTGAYAMLRNKGCGEVRQFKTIPTYCERFCSARDVCEQGKLSVINASN